MPRKAISSWKSPRGGASAPLPRPCQSLKAVGALVGVDADVFAVAVVDGDERRFETLEDLRLALLEFTELVQQPLAGRPSWPPHTRSRRGRPAERHELGRMNDPAACLITVVQYRLWRIGRGYDLRRFLSRDRGGCA